MVNDSKIAFIGAGNMANSLLRGLLNKGVPAANLFACDLDQAKLLTLQEECGIQIGSMCDIAKAADVIVLAVKPQVMKEVCQQLSSSLSNNLVISIAAGIPLSALQEWLGEDCPIVRSMPNTPALVAAGATGLFANAQSSEQHRQLAAAILQAVGIVSWLEREDDIDAVTALSGSGPAYYFLLMEAMEAAAVAMGLSAQTARELTLQTAYGAALLAQESDVPVAELRRRVTSPGGTTEQAVMTFQQGGLEQLVNDAMQAAQRRSRELADNFS